MNWLWRYFGISRFLSQRPKNGPKDDHNSDQAMDSLNAARPFPPGGLGPLGPHLGWVRDGWVRPGQRRGRGCVFWKQWVSGFGCRRKVPPGAQRSVLAICGMQENQNTSVMGVPWTLFLGCRAFLRFSIIFFWKTLERLIFWPKDDRSPSNLTFKPFALCLAAWTG